MLSTVQLILVVAIALQHLGFLVLEMFFWTKPLGLRIFGQSPEAAQASAILAANQGLYNGFLAAGLLWSAFAPHAYRFELQVFFLACVLIAGIYGGITASPGIFVVQGIPPLIALGVVALNR